MSINADGSVPDGSAMLDVKSTTHGLLIPRVSVTQRDLIPSPVTGLLIYNTSTNLFNYFNGSYWLQVETAFISSTAGTISEGGGVSITASPNGSPDNSAMLDVNDPSRGILVPRTTPDQITSPATGLIIYNTTSNLLNYYNGEQWITSNLGANHQATALTDATEPSAGWYWQFNRKQGYKHDGTTRTPNTTWISSISENLEWQAANDPCAIEMGIPWRIPTYAEWFNVDNTGGWTDWNGPWNSGLKLHVAGYLWVTDGVLTYRGSDGYYWSNAQVNISAGWGFVFYNSDSYMYNQFGKPFAFPLRCIRNFP